MSFTWMVDMYGVWAEVVATVEDVRRWRDRFPAYRFWLLCS